MSVQHEDLTITGNLTVLGTGTFTGQTTTDTATTSSFHVAGGLTVEDALVVYTNGITINSGSLVPGDTASKIVPGATSLALRNNADNANNLLISNAGAATVRSTLTVTAGGIVVTAGNLTFSEASAKIIPGATTFLIRDAGDANSNLSMTDAGVATIRAGLTLTTGPITMGTATSKIVPGATSLSLRNTADSADNLLISNAGAVTVRAGLTVTASGITITAGDVTFNGTSQKIIAPTTSLLIRDHADSNTNVTLTDAGAMTIRAGLTITASNLTFGAASAKIIPGVTSLLIQNNADNATNLGITDAGVVTVRGGLTVTAGGATITAGNLAFSGTSAKIIAGPTSLLIRDTADANTNVSVSDAGAVVVRAGLTVTASGITITSGALTMTAGNVTFTAAQSGVVENFASLTALGTNQGNAAPVISTIAYVTAADGTVGVVLPAAGAGLIGRQYTIINSNTSSALKVYAAGSDTIDGQAGSTAISVAAKLMLRCWCTGATAWYAEKGVTPF